MMSVYYIMELDFPLVLINSNKYYHNQYIENGEFSQQCLNALELVYLITICKYTIGIG